MPRRKSMLVLGLVLILLGSAAALVLVLLRHEPDFYRKAEVNISEEKKQVCIGTGMKLMEYFKDPGDQAAETFDFGEAELNSLLAHGFGPGSKEAELLEKQGISKPRISFDKDRIRLAFRHRMLFMSTVVSLEMRIWLVPAELNVFAVEIVSRRAGALPISTQALLEEISTVARKRKIEVSWYRHNGHPVALVRIQSNSPHPQSKFQSVTVLPGKLSIGVAANDQAAGEARGRRAPGPVILHGN